MKKNKIKNFIYSVLVIFSIATIIILIRTDFFKKSFFGDTFSSEIELPSSFDLRNVDGYNYTSPPKLQFWAACWDFASTSSLESNMLMHNQDESYYIDEDNDGIYEDSSHVLDFSERQIDYFIASSDYYDEGYNPFSIFNHLVARGGQMIYSEIAFATGLSPITQDKWEYPTGEVNLNIASVFNLDNVEYFVTEVDRFPNITESASQEVKDARMKLIKQYIMEYGAVAFAGPKGSASSNCFDRSIRLYQYSTSCDVVGGHAMEFIGWDDNYGPNGVGAWLVRDGLLGVNGDPDDAFYYMAYSFDAYFDMFIIKTVKNRDWDNDYNLTKKNEYSFRTISGKKVYQMKYYKDPNNDEKLRYINFLVDNENASYDLYISKTGKDSDYVFYDTITKDYPGLYTVEINDNIILESESFSIKIESISSTISNFGESVSIQAFTDDISESTDREIYVDYDIDNYVMSSIDTIRFNIYTHNISIDDTPSIRAIYNSNDEEVSELFTIESHAYYNDYGFIIIKPNGYIPLDDYTFKIGYTDIYMDLVVEALSSINHSIFSGGTGVENDPYLVSNINQLMAINTHTYYSQAYYELINDIDLSICKTEDSICFNNDKGWTPIGNYSQNFTGTFDGKNHKISNLYMNYQANYIGLFGYIKNATIKNLIVEDASVSGSYYVGAVVGYTAQSNLINIKSYGTVTGSYYVGGITGSYVPYNNTYISNVANYASVNGANQVGGIVGRASSYIIMSNSYNFGTISGNYSGGLVGIIASSYNDINIHNCFNAGNISGNTTGGIIGNVDMHNNNIYLENIYNIGYINGPSYKGQVIGKIDNNYNLTTAGIYILDNEITSIGNVTEGSNGNDFATLTKDEFIIQNSFINFDFINDWEIKNQNTYPTLRSNSYVYISDIVLEHESIEIEVGDDYQIGYTILPNDATNKNLEYIIKSEETDDSGDDSGRGIKARSMVISLSEDGLITANAIGNAKVTIIAKDNSYPIKEINIDVIPRKIHIESISLSEEELTIEVNEEHTLEYTINPNDATNKNVTFTSSDSNIVTVDTNGKVRGVNAGRGIVTVTTEDGNISDTISITVVIPVTGVEFNNDTLHLKRGELVNLEYTINPNNATNKNVTITSSDESIAMTDIHGRIMGINEGTATITIETEDGNYTDTLNVIVTNPVKSISLSEEELTIEVDEEHTLEYTINPNDATNKNVTFTSSDSNIVTVDTNGKVRGVNAGRGIVTVTTEDGNISDTISITVNPKVVLSSETYTVRDDFTLVIPNLITNEMLNSNIYSSYEISCDNEGEYIGTGTTITIRQENNQTSLYQIIVYGDVDGNGIINSNDIDAIINYIYKNDDSLSGVFLKAADYNSDSKYTLSDIMKIAKKTMEGE